MVPLADVHDRELKETSLFYMEDIDAVKQQTAGPARYQLSERESLCRRAGFTTSTTSIRSRTFRRRSTAQGLTDDEVIYIERQLPSRTSFVSATRSRP